MDVKTLEAVIENHKARVQHCEDMMVWCNKSETHKDSADIWMHCSLEAKDALFAVQRMLQEAQ